jgi:5-bromo-4-chloroindolyl phosphate hydrolysis protein
MSNFWIFLTAIVALSIIGDFVVKIVKASNSKQGSKVAVETMKDLEAELAVMEQDLEDARARIEVLEKIVTDDRYQLNKDINDLAQEA